jgi:predicted O-linked N-acetylglucosamine transferase (SPINDLY family)
MEQQHNLTTIEDYESAIAANPGDRTLYWHYGLALLLDRQTEVAQDTWFMVLAAAEGEAELWQSELANILEAAATEQIQTGNIASAWLIRQHLQEIAPESIDNRLQLLALSIANQTLSLAAFDQLHLIEALTNPAATAISQPLLFDVLAQYLSVAIPHPITVDFVKALLPHVVDRRAFVDLVLAKAEVIGHVRNYAQLSSALITVLIDCFPQDFELLLADCIFKQQQNDRTSLDVAYAALAHATTIVEKITASRATIQAFLAIGQQDASFNTHSNQHLQLLQELLVKQPLCDLTDCYRVMISAMHLAYVNDAPIQNRALQNQIMLLCEQNIQRHHQSIYDRYQATHQNRRNEPQNTDERQLDTNYRPLKIGYICRYFHRHSVGWLARWLLKHHDPEAVEVYIYLLNPQSTPDSVQQQYLQIAPHTRGCSLDATEISAQIHQDGIEILVELDSLTCQVTCEVMALKPAPIQVSWLGWDATGMSAIDYFIADPYVLPDSAQDDYIEKIVRLPQTYIAVEGFEVGVPTLHRSQLGLTEDAVLFMSAQRGYKRHPAMMRLQLQILQQVPNSYLLIKGLADQAAIQTAFWELALNMGVSHDRLIFLPIVDNEEIHRANLAIADVILDTYPYNGATTTLEALWMELPLVTRVGEQFAARNSYTMLKNVGIEVGIAWTDAEYVEWGVRLGTDAALRQQVSWQLRQAKQTAPLWNAAQFARAMEEAYKIMWQRFQQQTAN